MLQGGFLMVFGLILMGVGLYRMNKDFKKNKKVNNIIGFILTGQASGIGQLLSGIMTIIVGIVVMFMNK